MAQSEFTIVDILNKCWNTFSPIKWYWNDELIYDDDLDMDVWLSPAEAFKLFTHDHPEYKNYRVTSFRLEVVQHHHTILYMYGEDA